MELVPGAVVAGRYRVDRKVGEGGMGEVWAGEHVAIGVRVALKTLLPAAKCDHQVVTRFKREAQLLGRLRSDHVARVVDFVADDTFGLVLVMDFVEGESLAGRLQKGRLSVEDAIEVGVDVVSALCDLHRANVVHRDLKPDNIILAPIPGGRRRAVIVDFGVSRVVHREEDDEEDSITGITHADVTVGTIPYMAPEQVLSSRDVTGRSDIYAVGAILFRAVSGAQVFGDLEDIPYAKRKLTDEAPPLELPRFDRAAKGFQAIVAKALARRPEARFATAEQMLSELRALREIARAMAVDLDATTVGSGDDLMSDELTTEQTTRMTLEELALPANAGDDFAPPSAPIAPPPLPAPPQAEAPAVAPTPAAIALPARRQITLGAAVIGMVITLALGAALGLGAHRLIAGRSPPAGASPR